MYSLVLMAALAAGIPGGFEGVRDPSEPVHPRPVIDAPFLLAQAALWSGTYWDVQSTFSAFDRCGGGCHEGNPRMVQFVARGRGAVWGEQAKWNLGITAVSLGTKAAFRKNPNWILRHAWLIPPLWVAGTHIKNSIHNDGVHALP